MFVSSIFDGHAGWFHNLALRNIAALFMDTQMHLCCLWRISVQCSLIRKCSILLGESNYCFWLEQAPSAVSFSAFHKFVCSGPGGTLPQTPSYQLQNSLPGALFGKPVLARSSLTFNSEPPRASPPCALAETFPSCRKLGQEHSTAICLSFLRNQCHWLPCVQSPQSLCCMYFSPNSRILNQTLLL